MNIYELLLLLHFSLGMICLLYQLSQETILSFRKMTLAISSLTYVLQMMSLCYVNYFFHHEFCVSRSIMVDLLYICCSPGKNIFQWNRLCGFMILSELYTLYLFWSLQFISVMSYMFSYQYDSLCLLSFGNMYVYCYL